MAVESVSRLLIRLGLLLLVLYGVVVLFGILPIQLLQPDWILNFASILTNNLSIPLAAIAFIHLACYLRAPALGLFQLRVSRLAALLALLFLLIPLLLGFAVFKNNRQLAIYNNEQIKLTLEKGARIRQAVAASGSFQELQWNMMRLQGPEIPDQARIIALPDLKKEVLQRVKEAEANFPNQLSTPNSAAYKSLYKNLLRTSIISLVGFLSFGVLAWNPMTDKNMIFSYFGSIGLFGLKPANLARWFRATMEKRQDRADRMAAKKVALQHDRRMMQEQQKQMREQKRWIEEDKKRAEKLERQRQRDQRQ